MTDAQEDVPLLVDIVRKLAPHANSLYLEGIHQAAQPYVEGARDTWVGLFSRFKITTSLRLAHFLAQFLGETGGGVVLRESGDYTHAERIVEVFGPGISSAHVALPEAEKIVAQPMPDREKLLFERVYGLGNPHMAHMLGNIYPGDGWLFRGTGPLQSTGRGAARWYGMDAGVDFSGNPDLMLSPNWIMWPAVCEWNQKSLNDAADHNDYRHIRRMINGGYNGLTECKDWLERIWPAMKAQHEPDEPWQAAKPDNRAGCTVWLQDCLNRLGADPKLETDGRYGPATEKAVKWFQQTAGLKVDGVAGTVTRYTIQLKLQSKPWN